MAPYWCPWRVPGCWPQIPLSLALSGSCHCCCCCSYFWIIDWRAESRSVRRQKKTFARDADGSHCMFIEVERNSRGFPKLYACVCGCVLCTGPIHLNSVLFLSSLPMLSVMINFEKFARAFYCTGPFFSPLALNPLVLWERFAFCSLSTSITYRGQNACCCCCAAKMMLEM